MKAEWYYGENGAAVGPTTFEDIAGQIRQAKNGTHLVWTEGMEQWTAARDVPAFAELFRSLPPPLPPVDKVQPAMAGAPGTVAATLSATVEYAARTASISNERLNTHPWRRYFARMLDIYAFVLCASFTMGIMFPSIFSEWSSSKASEENGLLNVLYVAAFVPFEGFCLFAFGTTFGKAIYGIRLIPKDAEITFYGALRRSTLVWFRGLGIGIPIITLFTLIAAYNNLKKNGTTTWDAEMGWNVQHAAFSVARWIGVLACWGGMTFVVVILISLSTG
jgi:hypothetical protein